MKQKTKANQTLDGKERFLSNVRKAHITDSDLRSRKGTPKLDDRSVKHAKSRFVIKQRKKRASTWNLDLKNALESCLLSAF